MTSQSDDQDLASIEAQIAEIEAKRAARVSGRSKLEEKQLQLANTQALAAAEEEHGAENIRGIETRDGIVIVKVPPPVAYKRFSTALLAGKVKPEDSEHLARAGLVYPDRRTFNEMLERFPALADTVATQIYELARGEKPGN